MPWTVDNPPDVAQNWTAEEQRKCVAAANATLADGGSDEEAIFACIAAAGRSEEEKQMALFDRKEESLDAQANAVRNAWYETTQGAIVMEPPISSGYVMDVFEDYVIVSRDGSLYKILYSKDEDGFTFGDPIEVEIQYTEAKVGLSFHKQADGRLRWVAWATNNFRDNDIPREIISSKAHRDYVARADKAGQYPELWLWHTPGSRIGQADFLDYSDGFVIGSGLFDKGLEDVAERLSEADDLTMSHGFKKLGYDEKEHVITSYEMVEMSILPKGPEANPWTAFAVATKEESVISDDKRPWLVEMLGEDRVKAIEEGTLTLQKAALDAGVEYKEVETAVGDPASATEPTSEAEPQDGDAPMAGEQAQAMVTAIADAVFEQMEERLDLKGLSDVIAGQKAQLIELSELPARIKKIEDAVGALQQGDDVKIAEAITPKAAKAYSWMDDAPTKRADNTVTKEEAKTQGLQAPSLLERIVDSTVGLKRPG